MTNRPLFFLYGHNLSCEVWCSVSIRLQILKKAVFNVFKFFVHEHKTIVLNYLSENEKHFRRRQGNHLSNITYYRCGYNNYFRSGSVSRKAASTFTTYLKYIIAQDPNSNASEVPRMFTTVKISLNLPV